VLKNPFIPAEPTTKQIELLTSNDRELLFGGAAGGGKSIGLTMAALQYVNEPTYNALLVRKTYGMLSQPGALMDIMKEWIQGKGVHWDHIENLLTFPSGAQLKFGYFRNDADRDQYQGANYHFIGVDELTQFEEDQYLWLYSRNRAPVKDDIPIRIWSTSNPGSKGHLWVKQRFIEESNENRRYIPSRLGDNPHLSYEEYSKTLMQLDPITRQQLLEGNWEVMATGGYFYRKWFSPFLKEAPLGTKVRFWDLAASPKTATTDPDWTAGALVSKDKDGIYYLEHLVRTQDTAQAVEKLIRQTADEDGPEVSVVLEQEPGASGLQVLDYYRRHVLADRNLRAYKPSGPKESRIAIVSSHAEAHNLKIVQGSWIRDFLDEAELFPEGTHDDQLDAVAGAISMLQKVGGRQRIRWF
jgi:predicted phage terminase large subunit-like protein